MKQKIFWLLLLSVNFCLAQHKHNWAKYDSLPFKKDTLNNNWFSEYDNIIYPLNKSQADLEIRCYFPIHNSKGRILCYRIFNDSVLLIESIDMIYRDNFTKYDSSIAYKIENSYSWHIQKFKNKNNIDSTLSDLIENGLFNLANLDEQKKILNNKFSTAKSKDGRPLKYSFTDKIISYFEVKVNNRTRSFNIYSIRYDDENASTANYYLGWNLFVKFSELFNYIKFEKYEHSF